jgi:large subunit ribosomal protein L23Ae
MVRGNDINKILIGPISTEQAVREMEANNTLIFKVAKTATKKQIAWAIKKEFEAKVIGVRTQITMQGTKKAFIKLAAESSAVDVTSKLGLV